MSKNQNPIYFLLFENSWAYIYILKQLKEIGAGSK
jgi:hypothetical protein